MTFTARLKSCPDARRLFRGLFPRLRSTFAIRNVGRSAHLLPTVLILAVDSKAGAAVLLPAVLGGFGAEGLLLAVADDAEAAGGDAGIDEGVACGFGARLAELQVVFVGTALVAIAAEDHLDIRMAVEERRILGEYGLRVGANVGCVVVEEDVLHVGLEFIFSAHGGGGHLDGRRRIHGDARGCVGGAAIATRHEVIAGGGGGSDVLHTGCGHVADAVDGHAGGVSGAPGQHNLITGGDAGRSGRELRGGRRGGGWRRGFHRRERLLFLLAACNSDQGDEKQNRDEKAENLFQDGSPSAVTAKPSVSESFVTFCKSCRSQMEAATGKAG